MCSLTQTYPLAALDGEKTQSNWKSIRRPSNDSTDSGFVSKLSSSTSPQLLWQDVDYSFLEMPLPDSFPPTMPEDNIFPGHPTKNSNSFIPKPSRPPPPTCIARTDSGYGSFREDEDNHAEGRERQNDSPFQDSSYSDSTDCGESFSSFSVALSSYYRGSTDTTATLENKSEEGSQRCQDEAGISFDKLPILQRPSATSLLTTQFQNVIYPDIFPIRFRTDFGPTFSSDDLDTGNQDKYMTGDTYEGDGGDEKDEVLWEGRIWFFPTKKICKDHWVADKDSTTCSFCHMPFTMLRRRHHCRICGRVFCRTCCSGFACLSPSTLKPSPIGYPARICISCHIDSSQPPENWDHHGVKVFVAEMGWKLMGTVGELFGITKE